MDHRLQQLTSIQLESHFDAAATNSLTNSLSFCLHQLYELLQSPPAIRSYYAHKLQLAAQFCYAWYSIYVYYSHSEKVGKFVSKASNILYETLHLREESIKLQADGLIEI
jgi:hypothetical protein